MPAASRNDLLLLKASCLLRKAGESIVLCQDTDLRTSFSEAGRKRSADSADSALYFKSFIFKNGAVVFGRLIFLK